MRKTTKKAFTGMMAAALGITLLAGCGATGEKSADGNNDKVTIEFFSSKSENIQTFEGLIEEFEKQNPTIDVELNSPPEAGTVLKTRLTKNDLPDLMAIAGATYVDMAEAGVLEDFTDSPYLEKIQPTYLGMIDKLEAGAEEGTFGIPYVTNANGMMYNKDKLAELGLEVPQTWDEFVAALETAKDAGEIPIYFTLKDAWTGMIPWNTLAGNLGPENFAELKNSGEASFGKDFQEVADKMKTLLQYGHSDNFGIGYGDGNNAFANGEGVFYIQGNWAIPEILKANPDANIGLVPMPVGNNPEQNKLPSAIDVTLTMSADTEHKEEAKRFIEFLLEPEQATRYNDEQTGFSAINGVLQENPIMEGVKPNFEEGTLATTPDQFYPTGMQTANLVQAFLLDGDVEKFLSDLDKEWDKVNNR